MRLARISVKRITISGAAEHCFCQLRTASSTQQQLVSHFGHSRPHLTDENDYVATSTCL
jgi:hypothetical protein